MLTGWVDKAEMRPYRKPDGSVGYEAVPIVDEKPVTETTDVQDTIKSAVSVDGLTNEQVDQVAAMFGIGKQKAPEAQKPDTLSDKEKAAKLAALAGKNTRMNWTPEEEQQLLPIVIELFDGAMELGSVTFQKAVRYVREFIASNLDQATADAIPFETLQGAYIHTARKYKDQGATTGKEVMGFDSLEQLDKSVEKADIDTKDTQNDTATTGTTPALDNPLDAGQEQAPGTGNTSTVPARGNTAARTGQGRSDDGSVRPGDDGTGKPGSGLENTAGVSGASASTEYGEDDGVAGDGKRLSGTDYIPGPGGLTREGSWFDAAKRNIDLIELAIKIESENRAATPEEQAQLAKYVGFGASAIRNDLFPIPTPYAKSQEPNRLIWPQFVRSDKWRPLAERIDALPREWQQSILQSSQYAHYTSGLHRRQRV